MNILETVKKNLASIDFVANQPPLPTKQLINIIWDYLNIISLFLYLLFEARTDKEYMDSIFMVTVGIIVSTARVSSVMKAASFFLFIDDFEQVVNERE